MKPKTKASGVSAKNTKAEILAAYQELKQQLAGPKKAPAKTPATPTQVLENEIGQLAAVQKQVAQSLGQIFEALIGKTKKVTELIKTSQEEEEKAKRRRRREEEEYQFDLAFQRKKDEAEFREGLSEQEKVLAEKESLLEEKEKEFRQLQAQAAAFPKQLEQAVKEATEELAAELKKEKESEIKFLTQKFENELGLAQFKIKSLTEIKERQGKEINQLKDQLARSAREVKEIAVAVIESTGGKATETKTEETAA